MYYKKNINVGDILIFVGSPINLGYTKNKRYVVYKIDDTFIPGHRVGYFKNDLGDTVYFRDDDQDKNWIDLNEERKEKLLKINAI